VRLDTLLDDARPETTMKAEAPGIAPGRFVRPAYGDAYTSSSAIPAGTSCGCTGSSTRGGGAS
jgi:hypothetical protein